MNFSLGKKLIAVVDKQHVRLLEAEGIKVTRQIENISIDISKHKTHSKHEGSYHKNSEIGGFYDPHTDPKELEGKDSAKNILEHIENTLSEGKYSSVILASSPKILGYLRKSMNNSLKSKIVKEIDKDLINSDLESIEKKIFAN